MNATYVKRTLLALGAVLVVGIVAQIVVANTGPSIADAHKYGELDIPQTATLHLPGGTVDVILRGLSGDGIPSKLAVTVTPAGGGAPVTVTHDVGTDFAPSSRIQNLFLRRVFRAHIPAAGDYRVTTAGASGDNGYAIEFGEGPTVDSATIWALTGLAMLITLGVCLLVITVARARRP